MSDHADLPSAAPPVRDELAERTAGLFKRSPRQMQMLERRRRVDEGVARKIDREGNTPKGCRKLDRLEGALAVATELEQAREPHIIGHATAAAASMRAAHARTVRVLDRRTRVLRAIVTVDRRPAAASPRPRARSTRACSASASSDDPGEPEPPPRRGRPRRRWWWLLWP